MVSSGGPSLGGSSLPGNFGSGQGNIPSANPITPNNPPPVTSSFIATPAPIQSFNFSTSATIDVKSINDIINNLPSFLQDLTPDDQTKLLSYLFSTNILDAIFSTLDQSPSKDAFNALVDTLFKNGNLSQLGGSNNALSDTVKDAMKDSLQKSIMQLLVQGKGNAEDAGNAPLTLTIPNQDATSAQTQPFSQNLATLLGSATTEVIKNFLAANMPTTALLAQNPDSPNPATGLGGTLQSQTPQQVQFQQQLEDLVSQLLTLNLSNPTDGDSAGIQVLVPTNPDPSGMPKALTDLQQKLQNLVAEFATLNQFIKDEKLDAGQLQKFLDVPQQLMMQLKTMQMDDQSYLMMKTWVDNSKAIETAIAARGIDRQHTRLEFLQTLALTPVGTATADMMADKQQKQIIFDQIMMGIPNLLNFYKVKDAVEALAAQLKGKNAANLLKHKVLIFNAAREVIIVANGKPTPEYNDVGVFHGQLKLLATKLKELLPASAESMNLEEMELISFELKNGFEAVKVDEPHRFSEIMKRHPRTTLYFLIIDSPLCDDISYPALPMNLRGEIGPRELEQHLSRITTVVHKFEKMTEFLKNQPRMLEHIINETRADPSSDVTKNSLKIVHKAIADCTDYLDLEE